MKMSEVALLAPTYRGATKDEDVGGGCAGSDIRVISKFKEIPKTYGICIVSILKSFTR